MNAYHTLDFNNDNARGQCVDEDVRDEMRMRAQERADARREDESIH